MGLYLNPGNDGFRLITKGKYVDKTGLIRELNGRIDTPSGLICLSRPRRFGKSYAAKMLCAYYDHTCDSKALFEKYEIAGDESYQRTLNQYNVIALDIAGIISEMVKNKMDLSDMPQLLSEAIKKELVEYCPEIKEKENLANCFIECVKLTGRRFIFIIDEWDAVIRETNDEETQKIYLNLLRGWFKNSSFTPRVVAAAYMTGILPIKKDGSQSAISDFKEFTILNPGPFTQYTGFTEKEVSELCDEAGMDYSLMKQWYNGYEFDRVGAIYNPYSVMETISSGEYESHWQKTSVTESLISYINMDWEGLQEEVLKLMAGEELQVNVRSFMNDFENFHSKDDVITLLVHLGYLSYNKKNGTVRIPNQEIGQEFRDILKNPGRTKLAGLVNESEKLLQDTMACRAQAVAETIERVRQTNYAPQFYNDEQALRSVIKFAYVACLDRFLKVEELPSGKGLADIVFLPKQNTAYPAMLIELKWNRSAEGALKQIKEKRYPAILEGYVGEIVLVGINYDTKTKKHDCVIERINGGSIVGGGN